ncbi:DUF2786 domain-containing protein [soil metagenome]
MAARSTDRAIIDESLERLESRPRGLVAPELQRRLDQQMSSLWDSGWQPADVMRIVSTRLSRSAGHVMRCAVAADAASYQHADAPAARDWMAQIDAMGGRKPHPSERCWLDQVDGRWRNVLGDGVRILSLLRSLPDIPKLVPPPSEWGTPGSLDARSAALIPPGVLAKVRALLAKAESTSFDAEAEAFTAKAQELMTRHRIDRATLGPDGPRPGPQPVGRRMGVADPYARPKFALLSGVAAANGCRAVWSRGLGFATVFGCEDDLELTEELFTSLLLQATSALQREGSKRDRDGRSRTASYRRSFLAAFSARISQRLRDVVDLTISTVEAETGSSVLAVLDARESAVAAAVDEVFSGLKRMSITAGDREGWLAGTRLADEIDLAEASTPPIAPAPSQVRAASTRVTR